ncbi:SIMPL domain-containing protein [Sulfitobacter sp. D35]|uniref:SIMPL domain-containing protein n=1 Tax=Sulfitobacter sp. D35 TaxID=3083252 RepID=UPI00296EFE99|nr:SIMPL domain-containing protein [Sulfitobacter sp. D35]MDW4496974.1 SIMPL domain-containing protein [Sulfitobacter sp. D35]
MKQTLIMLCLVAGFGSAAVAQDVTAPRVITVTGEASVPAAPDMATIRLGVTEQAADAAAAMQAASAAVGDILARLDGAGIEARDRQTSGLSLQPVWSDRSGNVDAPPQITGYEARNAVTVRVRDLDALGGLLDAVIADGANTLDGLAFDVQDPAPLEREARKAAVADAMARAQDLAEAAGVTLGPVQSIIEQVRRGGPVRLEMADAARGASVPVAAGEVGFEGSVQMVFGIAD